MQTVIGVKDQKRRVATVGSLPEMGKFWSAYKTKMHCNVPSLTEHFVDRGTSATGTFVSSVVDQLLAG